jgi:hypothetical protein
VGVVDAARGEVVAKCALPGEIGALQQLPDLAPRVETPAQPTEDPSGRGAAQVSLACERREASDDVLAQGEEVELEVAVRRAPQVVGHAQQIEPALHDSGRIVAAIHHAPQEPARQAHALHLDAAVHQAAPRILEQPDLAAARPAGDALEGRTLAAEEPGAPLRVGHLRPRRLAGESGEFRQSGEIVVDGATLVAALCPSQRAVVVARQLRFKLLFE